MTYRGPWNAANWRHRQTPRKYKPVDPIGEYQPAMLPGQCYLEHANGDVAARCCQFCGYHVCSCNEGKLTLDKAISRATQRERLYAAALVQDDAKRIADEVLKQAMPEPVTSLIEAHRASMQPQGGTAADTPAMRYGCVHMEGDARGCEVCALAKLLQASERVRPGLRLGDEVIYTSTERPECYGMGGRVTYITVSGDMVTVSCTMGSLVGFKAADFQLVAAGRLA